MTAALLLGLGAGLGLCLLVAGLFPARPTLATALNRLDQASRTAQPSRPLVSGGPDPVATRLRRWLGLRLAPGLGLTGGNDRLGLSPQSAADLAVTGTPTELHAGAKMLSALVGLAAPLLLTLLLSASGLTLPLLVPLWVSLTGAPVGFLLPDLRLRRTAADARRAFRGSVGAFLDLVAMRMASGSGLAEALHDAARIGHGPAFAQIRGALADARTDGLTPAQALGQLGAALHLPDLVEVSTRLRLVDASGAQTQASLRAQAASLRDRELSDAQGRANEQSQSMLVAQVVLGLGFVLFLGYPAVARVLAT
ncbi:MAG: type II secretion system F family protein [Mycobacteriales bacterium]